MSETMETWHWKDMVAPDAFEKLRPQTENIFGKVRLEFSDGVIQCSRRWAFVNLIWFSIPAAFNIPLRKDHFIRYKPLNKGIFADEITKYYDEIMHHHPPFENKAKRIKDAIFAVHTKLYNFGYIDLVPYAPSFDIVDLAEITHDKAVKPIVDSVRNIDETWNTRAIEKLVSEKNKELQKVLSTKGLVKNQALQSFQRVGQLNPHQIYQTLLTFSTRTDVDDHMINRPVYGSAIDGLQDVYDFAIESLSAKKSQYYNKTAIKNSQYFNRRIQLIASSVEQVYDGDCGTNVTTDFLITDGSNGTTDVRKNVIGMYIIENGKKVLLCSANVDSYVGKVVKLRSSLTCRYTNGVCETCLGALGININRYMNIGILAAISVISQITQKILSAKHLIKTLSIFFSLSERNQKVLTMTNTADIYWKPDVVRQLVAGHGKVGVSIEDFIGFDDIQNLRADKAVEVKRISRVRTLYARDENSKDVLTLDLNSDTATPSLSSEMLFFIREHLDTIEVRDGIYWIPIEGTERLPILSTTVVNDDMISFVTSCIKFFSDKIGNYSTNKDCLAAATNLIYSKASVNLSHICTVLKAFQVNNLKDDFRIPVVTDSDKVIFAKENMVLNYRAVGTKLAYQELPSYFSDPKTYTVAKQRSDLDWLVGYTN